MLCFRYDLELGCSAPEGDSCGHYTQMVLDVVTEIGCGISYCDDVTYISVCLYNPGQMSRREADGLVSCHPYKRSNNHSCQCYRQLCGVADEEEDEENDDWAEEGSGEGSAQNCQRNARIQAYRSLQDKYAKVNTKALLDYAKALEKVKTVYDSQR